MRFIQVALGITLMFLGIGAMQQLARGQSPVSILLFLGFLAVVAIVGPRFSKREDPAAVASDAPDLEQRMNDLQEIVLGLDEKLTRLAKKIEAPPASSTEERSG